MKFLHCVQYLVLIGIIAFIVGRILAWFPWRWDRFPFKSFAWEKEGKIYNKLHIRKWQAKVPDMSRILRHWIPRKELSEKSVQDIPKLIRETIVAEIVHWGLSIAGVGYVVIWPVISGTICWILYILIGNLPFICIQRYNRPRLVRFYERYKEELEKNGQPQEVEAKCAH